MEPILEYGRDNSITMRHFIREYFIQVTSDFAITRFPNTILFNEVPYGIYSQWVILLELLDSEYWMWDLFFRWFSSLK
jgi:hypothetical protein